MNASLAPGIIKSLHDAGLIADESDIDACPLSGGVSSDIWRLKGVHGAICLKRALTKLKVKDDWFAPITRNASEVAWLKTIATMLPDNVPEVLHHDEEQGFFVMRFYDPTQYKNWKQELLAGRTDIGFAEQVGRCMGIIHGMTFADAEMAQTFANDGTFFDIRIEPYLLATAARHADVSERLATLADVTAATKVALVHGDISPKNILIGPDGPLFIDAECAWFGDPAFDMAFCLNHLLLKCVHAPSACTGFKLSFDMLCHGYEAEIQAKQLGPIMQRTAHLLPGLLLARIDGKSPVEYITDSADKDVIRQFAKRFLLSPVDHPLEVCAEWHRTMPALAKSSL
jgi:aminoglycoside phosphotransferase (APT) family kinase protein